MGKRKDCRSCVHASTYNLWGAKFTFCSVFNKVIDDVRKQRGCEQYEPLRAQWLKVRYTSN
jgi:quinol monooxygenase YgiN